MRVEPAGVTFLILHTMDIYSNTSRPPVEKEEDIKPSRPSRGGRYLPVEKSTSLPHDVKYHYFYDFRMNPVAMQIIVAHSIISRETLDMKTLTLT